MKHESKYLWLLLACLCACGDLVEVSEESTMDMEGLLIEAGEMSGTDAGIEGGKEMPNIAGEMSGEEAGEEAGAMSGEEAGAVAGTEVNVPACQDGIDNDEDGLADFPQDPGCGSANDDNEYNELIDPECSDGVDNDRDYYTDEEDPGCTSAADPDEGEAEEGAECWDQIDNDYDQLIDFPYDPGCNAAGDPDEQDPPLEPQCSNSLDDDGDGLTDFPNDPGCAGKGDRDETDKTPAPQCSDGLDNDRDGYTDYPEDDGCISAADYGERGSCGNTYDPPRIKAGEPLSFDTSRGLFESQGSCGGQGSPELVASYFLSQRIEALEISTVSANTVIPTTLYVRRVDCLNDSLEIACQREALDTDEYGHILTVPNLSPGEYFIFMDGVAGAGGQVELQVREIPLAQCLNGIDDDQDGRIDYPQDAGCELPEDISEDTPAELTVCSNDEDDDQDGLVDYPLDPGCVSAASDSEVEVCGDGISFKEYFFGQNEVFVNTALDDRVSTSLNGTCGGDNLNEVIFRYRNPQNARLEISTNHEETESPSIVYIRSECSRSSTELRCSDGSEAGAQGGRVVISQARPGDYWIIVDTRFGDGGWVKLTIDAQRLDPPCEGGIGPDYDEDGLCDDGEDDDDNDGILDADDLDPLNELSCQDLDADGCDDCSLGEGATPDNDGDDFDADGLCDRGDLDIDGDGVEENPSDPLVERDNCPNLFNPEQTNSDPDTRGDACDTDDDNDRVLDIDDAEPTNPFVCRDLDEDSCDDCSALGQSNTRRDGDDLDNDGLCDLGDPDIDNDDIDNENDNCPNVSNNLQANEDSDEFGDACDDDLDNDTILNDTDNCPTIANVLQENFDQDEQGDLCDTDIDNDGVSNELDSNNFEITVCQDNDIDGCDDCALGEGVDASRDGDDLDGDGLCNDGDDDIDGDGINNIDEPGFEFSASSCGDRDNDGCDDCVLNQGIQEDNDGLDTDSDGTCDLGDLDDDNDTILDEVDNCPLQANTTQDDQDNDDIGNICDDDVDGDGVLNIVDNCSDISNELQEDLDEDNIGNACDLDIDGDGINNVDEIGFELDASLCGDRDNDLCDDCSEGNGIQQSSDGLDTDSDGLCDEGDLDDDGDGQNDDQDNCPLLANGTQDDQDTDNIGDVCDDDLDGDGVLNDVDNCSEVSNAQQEDLDEDDIGNVCDLDADGDFVPNVLDIDDLNPFICTDSDNDTCDDCSIEGLPNPNNDGCP